MTRSYWDLSEKERSELSAELVESMLDFELMEKGVLKVAPLVLEPIEEVDLGSPKTYYEVGPVVFDSAEKCAQFLALSPMIADRNWRLSRDAYYPKTVDPQIAQRALYDAALIANATAALERAQAAKERNEKAEAAFQKASKAQAAAVAGVWNDYHECRDRAALLARIKTTRDEYVAMAGDGAKAMFFLEKVFDREEIADAQKWFGETWNPDVVEEVAF